MAHLDSAHSTLVCTSTLYGTPGQCSQYTSVYQHTLWHTWPVLTVHHCEPAHRLRTPSLYRLYTDSKGSSNSLWSSCTPLFPFSVLTSQSNKNIFLFIIILQFNVVAKPSQQRQINHMTPYLIILLLESAWDQLQFPSKTWHELHRRTNQTELLPMSCLLR